MDDLDPREKRYRSKRRELEALLRRYAGLCNEQVNLERVLSNGAYERANPNLMDRLIHISEIIPVVIARIRSLQEEL